MQIFGKQSNILTGASGAAPCGSPLRPGLAKAVLGLLGALALCVLSSTAAQASAKHSMTEFNTMPVNLVQQGTAPRLMIATSNDHQLFFKAYNDFNDLDKDGSNDTTYKNSINYYGYFDSYKCYDYDTGKGRFVPKSFTTDKYCTGAASNYWSGNFLNWATMARIDVVRKILFGGHRRVDSPTETVLERTYLPYDAHSWAKHYSGADLPKLTPFKLASSTHPVSAGGLYYYCDDEHLSACGNTKKSKLLGVTFGNTTDVPPSYSGYSEKVGDPPVLKTVVGNYSLWASGSLVQLVWYDGSPYRNQKNTSNYNDSSRSGIYAYDKAPEWNKRLGQGDYIVRVQACVAGLIDSDEVAAISGSTKETCKLYPGPDGLNGTSDDDYKPIGLLQRYGDDGSILFGMIAGSYYKHTKGGTLVRNIRNLKGEVNVDTDGSFPKVAGFASTRSGNPSTGEGIINAWSLYRPVGFLYNYGNSYGGGDQCTYLLTAKGEIAADGRCRNWGNPFAEIFAQAISYMGGKGVISDYTTTMDAGVIPGLPAPESYDRNWLPQEDYCAQLHVLAFNSSMLSYDADNLDTEGSTAFKPADIWGAAFSKNTVAMTDEVGKDEGLYNTHYFFGQRSVDTPYSASNPDVGDNNQLCTSKNLTSLGMAGGLCPEAPRLFGSYRLAGLAYYAHVADINQSVPEKQVVNTYGVALASGLPILEVPQPLNGSAHGKSGITIMPACRMIRYKNVGNCAIVDFRIVSEEIRGNKVVGKTYVNWEDSEQGGDYDMDMWGTMNYEYDADAGTIAMTTQVHGQTGSPQMALGYVINGTTEDGFHAHSGMNQYVREERVDAGYPNCSAQNGIGGCKCTPVNGHFAGCSVQGPSRKTYVVRTSSTRTLESPLWYAAKYGGFKYDKKKADDPLKPGDSSRWDTQINATGGTGSDGIPDNYFYATNPQELENSLKRIFDALLDQVASGTTAAVAPSSSSGEGAIYQSHYQPRKKVNDRELRWFGSVQALWSDSAGNNRQDCTPIAGKLGVDPSTGMCLKTPTNLADICVPNGRLDDYCVDQVVQSTYDGEKLTSKILASTTPDAFKSYSMQGVVSSFDASTGQVLMVPNSMEGNITYDAARRTLTLEPYSMTATVKAYNPETGVASITINDASKGPAGATASEWHVTTTAGAGQGITSSSLSFTSGASATITLEPAGDWLVNWVVAPTYDASGNITAPGTVDPTTITLKTKRRVGPNGSVFRSWDVACLDGSGSGVISGVDLPLDNSTSQSNIAVKSEAGSELTGCKMARFSSYNMQGTAGESIASWNVANLNGQGTGTSTTTLTLANSGSKTFAVEPKGAWLAAGDPVQAASYVASPINFDDIGYIWNAEKQLYLDGVTVTANRAWNATANTGRYIMTWVDSNRNGKVESGEYLPFETSLLGVTDAFKFFDVADLQEAKDVINYVRGEEISGTRTRTMPAADSSSSSHILRLGDVMNSSPAVVGTPRENIDIIYGDRTYRAFRTRYLDRRTVVYAGANDGLLHAFNGGFYTTETLEAGTDKEQTLMKYSVSGATPDGTAAVEHPLGAELWAYAPGNLLPHLQWLKAPEYGANNTHVSYVDGRPRVFDARIFPEDTDHPKGWGTLLVVGMGQGGGSMELTGFSPSYYTHSAYVVFDVTNPEKPPVLLGEIPLPDATFTTMYPAAVAFQDRGSATTCNGSACNDWYLLLGSGPTGIDHTSSQNAHVYLFDLSQLRTQAGVTPSTVPSGCSVQPIRNGADFKVLACDTRIANSFVGNPSVVDWQLDFKSDAAYIGVVASDAGKKNATNNSADSGALLKLDFSNSADMSGWTLNTFLKTNLPVSAQPLAGIDKKRHKWIYFGTGRYWNMLDKLTADEHYLYGVKDPLATAEDKANAASTGAALPVLDADLLDVSGVDVYSDGALTSTVVGSSGTLTTFNDLLGEAVNKAAGWKRKIPGLISHASGAPSTRNLTRSALAGGVLFATVFQPSSNPCEGLGQSALYGLDYRTGTANPKTLTLGTRTVYVNGAVRYLANAFVLLGSGSAGGISISAGKDGGNNTVTVNTQLSTGSIEAIKAKTTEGVRSGRVSWEEDNMD